MYSGNEEKIEAARIIAKIKREGRGSLTKGERTFAAYSPYVDAAGCACARSIPIHATQN